MSAGNSWLLPVIFISIGALIGALLAALFSGSKSEPEEEASTGQDNQHPRKPAGLQEGSYQEIALLWRDETTGKLLAEMNGITYSSLEGMDPEARQAAQKTALQWLSWTGQNAPAPAARVQEASSAPPDLEALKINLPPAGSRRPSILPGVENDQDKTPEAVKESIVVQIDNILQDMLAGSVLHNRGIHLAEGPNMSVIVWIGSEHFQGIDQVPDPAIAHVIRKAVAEWEKRSVPS